MICDAAGTATGSASTLVGNPFSYVSRRHDQETGLFYYRARQFSSLFGRFLGRDPFGYRDSNSLYRYVDCDPLSSVDPSGKWRERVDDDYWERFAERNKFPIFFDPIDPGTREALERYLFGLNIEIEDPCEANYRWEYDGICGDNWGRCNNDCEKTQLWVWNLPWDLPIYSPSGVGFKCVGVIQNRTNCKETCDSKRDKCQEIAKRRYEKCKKGELSL
jgi:RHS repeat-associated protein